MLLSDRCFAAQWTPEWEMPYHPPVRDFTNLYIMDTVELPRKEFDPLERKGNKMQEKLHGSQIIREFVWSREVC